MKQKKRLDRRLIEVSTHYDDYLRCQSKKERGECVRETAELFGVNKSTINRWFNDIAKNNLKAKRRDHGKPRNGYTEEQMKSYCSVVAGFKWESMTKTNKVIETGEAVRVLCNAGQLPEILPTTTVNTWLRRLGMSIEAIKHYKATTQTRLYAEFANQWWMVDASVSELYYLNGKGRMVDDTKIAIDKNHGEEILTKKGYRKIIIYCAVDLYSKAYYVRGFVAPGESTNHWLAFLMECFSEKEESAKFPFRGIPLNIYSDKGSGLISHQTQQFFECLGITFQHHAPGNARAKGAVERRIGLYKSRIEAMFRFYRPSTIEEYNKLCYMAIVRDNLKKGFISKWLDIQKTDNLVEFDDDKRTLVGYKYFERKVGAHGCVSIENTDYYVNTRLNGEWVTVYRMVNGDMKAIDANGIHYEVTTADYQQTKMGTFHKPKKTDYDRDIESLEAEGKRLRDVIRPEHFSEELPTVSAIKRPGKEAEVDSPFVRQGYTTVREAWTKIVLATRLSKRQFPADLVESVDTIFTGMLEEHGEIPPDEFDDILEHMITVSTDINLEENYG